MQMIKHPYYSKKVIKHFTNPKNFGEIKNADGIGRVGNPACLLLKQNIHINTDLKEIDKISPNDKVLSHNGKYNKVIKSVKRDYKGKTLIIKNKLGKIQLTPDHLILAAKLPKEDKFLRTKNKKKILPSWHHAAELEKGDIILYPILKEEKNLENIKIDILKPKWDFKSKEIPKEVLLSPCLLRLFSYFLSEGYVADRPCRAFISFTLNINEKEIVKDIKETSKKLFALDAAIRKLPKRKTVIVSLYSAKLARFFKKLFRTGAENKTIPDFIMNLPFQKQKPLIYGLWKGDGYVNLSRIGSRAGYSTISYKLAQQIKILLLRQKIIPSIYEEKERESNGVKHKKAYRIHVGQRDSLIKLCSILGINYMPRSYTSEQGWFDNNFLYTPITKIERKQYHGKVYNLEVQNAHSFTSGAFCLHNCGDIMTLYIKVGRKVKDEIIKDIKFHTLGCAAAIATSDIACDLVKGKTLKQALKIKHKDIVAGLGYLSPIKIHCSLLAEQGLKAAIEDYEKKKNKEEESSCGDVGRCGFKCGGCPVKTARL